MISDNNTAIVSKKPNFALTETLLSCLIITQITSDRDTNITSDDNSETTSDPKANMISDNKMKICVTVTFVSAPVCLLQRSVCFHRPFAFGNGFL